jgi:riboflavin kinase/FMN adenylyltransferase
MKQLGVRRILIPDFSRAWAETSAEDFARGFLCEALRAKYVAIGFNYHFGRRAEGRAADLVRFGSALGFEVDVVPAFCVDGEEISSTRIRESIRAGHLEEPYRLLGRPHELCGTVVRGEGRGRTLGYPTANLEPDLQPLLPPGVYAVLVYRDDVGEEIPLAGGMLFRGPRRTFGEPKDARSVEVHLFDFEGDLYGAHLRLEVFTKIREGKKFDSPEGLIRQLGLDRAACEDFFRADGRGERRRVCS